MGTFLDPDSERAWQDLQAQLDLEVKNRWRGVNLEAEIAARRGGVDPDPVRTRVGVLLVRAWGALIHAWRQGAGFSDVCAFADEALKLQPDNADALALRAIAKARLSLFSQAAEDAEKATALDPDAGSLYNVPARRLLRALRGGS
jgi:tetratricopeptide (TPR) repeat protein